MEETQNPGQNLPGVVTWLKPCEESGPGGTQGARGPVLLSLGTGNRGWVGNPGHAPWQTAHLTSTGKFASRPPGGAPWRQKKRKPLPPWARIRRLANREKPPSISGGKPRRGPLTWAPSSLEGGHLAASLRSAGNRALGGTGNRKISRFSRKRRTAPYEGTDGKIALIAFQRA